jgi:hypothetical protein
MCCFTRPVKDVSDTRIFARPSGASDQIIVYSMHLSASEDLAMVLPIPSDRKTGEKAVSFIDLSGYPAFFAALRRGFPERVAVGTSRSAYASRSAPLKVETVGSYEASFVPTTRDFDRLDERFRLPDGTWEKLGSYADFGFVVFKLRRGSSKVHPMAFKFASARPGSLFFPTVHVHDGTVHDRAAFDHELYCQVQRTGVRALTSWRESELPAARFINASETKGVILGERHVFKQSISGVRTNEDIVLAVA